MNSAINLGGMKGGKMKKIAVLGIFVLVLMASLLGGCAGSGEEIPVPTDLSELSLSQLWEATLEATDVHDLTASLYGFHLLASEDGSLDSLHFEFSGADSKGISKMYSVIVNPKGELDWHSYDAHDVKPAIHPIVLFNELDKVDLVDIAAGQEGLFILVGFREGSCRYNDIYLLKNAELMPLKEISFYSDIPWCEILVCKRNPPENITTNDSESVAEPEEVTIPESPEDRQCQVWFLSQDLDKAISVKYIYKAKVVNNSSSEISDVHLEMVGAEGGISIDTLAIGESTEYYEFLLEEPRGEDIPISYGDYAGSYTQQGIEKAISITNSETIITISINDASYSVPEEIIAKAYTATSEVQSYRMERSSTTTVEGETSTSTLEAEIAGPNKFYAKTTNGGWTEFVRIETKL
jgi:hypothetical protein